MAWALEAEADVGVSGDADMGVAEEFLDHDEAATPLEVKGGGRVA